MSLTNELTEIYLGLSDVTKLVLCSRDVCVADLYKVAYKLGIGMTELTETFPHAYDDLLETVDSVITSSTLEEETELVLNECVDWCSKMYYADPTTVQRYLNSKGD